MTRDYPQIVRQARAGAAQVCWAGRSRLYGVAPALQVISTATTRGSVRFGVLSGRTDGPVPAGILARLTAHEGRAVHVIVDGSFAGADWPRRLPEGVVLHPMPSCARVLD